MKKLFLPVCAALVALPFVSSAEPTYQVKKGDTLYRIAKKLQVDLDELKEANHLSSSSLKPGKKLVIPVKAAGSARRETPAKVVEETPAGSRDHTRPARR
jgi:LysM repeat protein